MRSPTYQLMQDRLGDTEDLAAFVKSRRESKVGWERVARELEDRTGVYVSWATLARWFPELAKESA